MKRKFIPIIILCLTLLLGIFFRVYKLENFYPFGHDQDLFAWIAKDIVIDHHFRLIGQETSIIGVFIGPLFYYLIALCFALFNMEPLSAAIVTTIFSIATIISIYYVFAKFYGNKASLIGSFLYAVSPGVIFIDRWVVPTQPTILWAVWFLYVLFSIIKGNYQILIPLSILLGLIWHIHIAFIPLLLLLPLAFVLSRGKYNQLKFHPKTILISLSILLILLAPLFAFEVRHNFQQTKSIIHATYRDNGDVTGIDRLIKVLNSGGRSLAGAFLLSNPVIELNSWLTTILPFVLLIGLYYSYKRQLLNKNQAIIILVWIGIVFFGQFISKRIITEYYFNNLFIVLFLILSLILAQLKITVGKVPLVGVMLVIYLSSVTIWFLSKPDDQQGFYYRRRALEFIKNHSESLGYPCLGINHIENYPNRANGFRYLMWYYKLNTITPGNDVPVYSIVNPWTLSSREITARFGDIGVIVPTAKQIDPSVCTQPQRQLLPLWGFNN